MIRFSRHRLRHPDIDGGSQLLLAAEPDHVVGTGPAVSVEGNPARVPDVLVHYRGRVPLADTDLAGALAPAGLRFIEREGAEVRLPLRPGRSAASSRREDGRIDCRPDEVVDVADPDMTAKVNAGWLRLAEEYGLFDRRREFLIGVDCSTTHEPEMAWVRVQLLDEWD